MPNYFGQLGSYYQPQYVQPTYQHINNPIEQQQSYVSPYDMGAGQTTGLKGRPVVSIEEARAAQIDLDGTLFVFTDIANNKIYTKQVNLDGIAVLKTYSLTENGAASDYVTKAELNQIIASFKQELLREAGGDAQQNESINEQQSGTTKKTICKQPAF